MQRARWGKRGAPGSVRSHVRAEGNGLSACDPDGRAAVKEVFGAAPGDGFIGGLLPDGFEDCGWFLFEARESERN